MHERLSNHFMRAFATIALALVCPLLVACSTSGSSPTPRGAENAGALHPNASKIKIDEPTEPVLLAVGQFDHRGHIGGRLQRRFYCDEYGQRRMQEDRVVVAASRKRPPELRPDGEGAQPGLLQALPLAIQTKIPRSSRLK